MSQAQIMEVRALSSCDVHLLKEDKKSSERKSSDRHPSPANHLCHPCRFCGRQHETSCGQTYFNSSRGTVQSPNSYGYNYATGLDCKYDISVRSGNGVKLSWRTFDVKGHMPSCNNDYVEIYKGCRSDQRSIGRFCSENSQKPFNVYSPDGCLQLVFRTDSSGGGKGFQADYERISPGSGACSGRTTMYSRSGVIHSYKWPLPDTLGRDCYWEIDVESNKGIKIAFMDVSLDYESGCGEDMQGGSIGQSYYSSSTIQDSMCGTKRAFSLTSTKSRIWISFKSDGYSRRGGFVAGYVLYDAHQTSSCGQNSFSSSIGTVKSPNSYGYNYADGLYCVGSIGQSYNSSSTIQASLCRSQKAFSLTSTKGRIWIRFKSKGYRPERGFVVGYVIYDTTKRSSGSSGATVVGIILAILVFTVAAV
ncbi:tolloid-like protein 2 [Acropora muricata]|uniref:tolloid-like protein 2 n=1 Tax=Acropora muricata TaxID=159855 RepID=UPI0034E4587B